MKLTEARSDPADSPAYRLISGLKPPRVGGPTLRSIEERSRRIEAIKVELAEARRVGLDEGLRVGLDEVVSVEAALGSLDAVGVSVLVDLLLSYRALEAWEHMIDLVHRLPQKVSELALVQEQLGLALNRAGRSLEAERVVLELLERQGPSADTFGILGRIRKDRWVFEADPLLKERLLAEAIDAYLQGFEADWRDAYPGVNAVILMELADPPDPRRLELLPVVRYASERRASAERADYWDHVTRLELAVVANDEDAAGHYVALALATVRESWEPQTTRRNLELIRDARTRRGEKSGWLDEIIRSFGRAG
jgi:hypothetical protein